ncbi:hypothetical protein [Actinomadura sp. 9N215]|uniref:hypothetical protein n=1 Tax=Actinomadura sp. 9N215 TaxID=3375150 RepID=UPI00379EBB27
MHARTSTPRSEEKARAISEAARYVRVARYTEGYDTEDTRVEDVRDILTQPHHVQITRFSAAFPVETRTALGRLHILTLWRIARMARRGDNL